MPSLQSWQRNESTDLVIRHLVAGQCVALPSESTYELVASALQPDAVVRLCKFGAPAFVLGDYANLFDWMPLLRGAGPRLFRKVGPGPIALQANGGFATSHFARLPEATKQLMEFDRQIAVRWPAHEIWSELRRADIPLVSVPIQAGVNAETAASALGDNAACVIDGGPAQFGLPPSIVQVEGRRARLVRVGGLTSEQFDELTLCRIVFICTGNTCRSPMAEALCVKLLADALGCAPADLRKHGYVVESAGLAAMNGSVASPDGVRVVADIGADLSQHRSRSASMEMLVWADYIFTMTASHLDALLPIAEIPLPRLLSPEEDDVADPIGGELADYRTCAEQIIQCLRQRLPEILES